jgi:hypothetical protein
MCAAQAGGGTGKQPGGQQRRRPAEATSVPVLEVHNWGDVMLLMLLMMVMVMVMMLLMVMLLMGRTHVEGVADERGDLHARSRGQLGNARVPERGIGLRVHLVAQLGHPPVLRHARPARSACQQLQPAPWVGLSPRPLPRTACLASPSAEQAHHSAQLASITGCPASGPSWHHQLAGMCCAVLGP